MTPEHDETLSSFFDGEDVDPDQLAVSLQEADATETLIEFARLRRTVRQDAGRPSEEFCQAMRERLARAESGRTTRRRFMEMSLAASLALAAAVGGFGLRALLDKPGAAPAARPGTSAGGAGPPSAGPVGATPPARAGATVPSPSLRLRFTEWRDAVL